MLGSVFLPIYFFGIFAGALLGGWLQGLGTASGAKVGAMAGFLATIPFIILVIAFFGVGTSWLIAQGVPAEIANEYLAGFGIVAIFVIILALFVNILSGLFGGLVGGAITSD